MPNYEASPKRLEAYLVYYVYFFFVVAKVNAGYGLTKYVELYTVGILNIILL